MVLYLVTQKMLGQNLPLVSEILKVVLACICTSPNRNLLEHVISCPPWTYLHAIKRLCRYAWHLDTMPDARGGGSFNCAPSPYLRQNWWLWSTNSRSFQRVHGCLERSVTNCAGFGQYNRAHMKSVNILKFACCAPMMKNYSAIFPVFAKLAKWAAGIGRKTTSGISWMISFCVTWLVW